MAPKTLSPMANFGGFDEEEVDDGVRSTVPANSEPEIQGRRGWCWYLPRIWSRSKKLAAVAWMAIRYSLSVGLGSGTVVTVRSLGPCLVGGC